MDIITNRQALAHMPVKELAVFLKNIAESPVKGHIDYEKWLNSDITVSIFDVTGELGIYHEKRKENKVPDSRSGSSLRRGFC